MRPLLAALLVLAVASAAQGRPHLKKSLEAEAAQWQGVLIAQQRAAQDVKSDQLACEQCLAGQDFLKACKDIDVSKYKGVLVKKSECVTSCEYAQEGQAYDLAVKLRLADKACLEASRAPDAELVALDMGEDMTKETKAWLARCAECAPAALIKALRRGLQDALDLVGAERGPKLDAAIAAVKKYQQGCAMPSDACKFKP